VCVKRSTRLNRLTAGTSAHIFQFRDDVTIRRQFQFIRGPRQEVRPSRRQAHEFCLRQTQLAGSSPGRPRSDSTTLCRILSSSLLHHIFHQLRVLDYTDSALDHCSRIFDNYITLARGKRAKFRDFRRMQLGLCLHFICVSCRNHEPLVY